MTPEQIYPSQKSFFNKAVHTALYGRAMVLTWWGIMEEGPDSKTLEPLVWYEKHVYTDTNREFIESPSQLCWNGISVLGLLQNWGPNLLKEKP